MWRYIDVQADWRSSTYGRAPNAIDISEGSLTCPSKHRHGIPLFTVIPRNRPILVAFNDTHGDTEGTFSTYHHPPPPGALRWWFVFFVVPATVRTFMVKREFLLLSQVDFSPVRAKVENVCSVSPATKWGGVSESPYKKGGSRVGAWTGKLENPTKCLWRWGPDRRSNFFSPPAHLCRPMYDWIIVDCDVKVLQEWTQF